MVTWPAKNFTRQSCWPVMLFWDGHVVHSWINDEIPNCKSESFNLFFIMTSHKNIHLRISVRAAKDHSLAVCHAFKINRNAIWATGVKSVQKNIKPIFKRSSSDWNKQIIFVGLIRLTLRVLDFFVNILISQKGSVTELKLLWPVNTTGYSPISKATV